MGAEVFLFFKACLNEIYHFGRKKMKNVIIGMLAFTVVFWNLENFMDCRKAGRKYSFYRKCEAVCKEIFRMEDELGDLPDAVGFAEVEDSFVVWSLLKTTLLRKTPYSFIHYDSPDHRGIDCVLLYRRDRLRLLNSKPNHVCDSLGRVMATRDILLGSFETRDSARVDILVNHHPSQIGGKTEGRNAAKACMQRLCDSLASFSGTIVSIGDFNEGPGWKCGGMKDLSENSIGSGSIRFNGEWELIDRCYTDTFTEGRMRVFDDSVLTEPDSVHGGEKPRRTAIGPRYNGGVSDHYPIVVELDLKARNRR